MDFHSSERLKEINKKIESSQKILDWVDENVSSAKRNIVALEASIKFFRGQMRKTVNDLVNATDKKLKGFLRKSYEEDEELLNFYDEEITEERHQLNQLIELHPKHIQNIHNLVMERERIYMKGK